MENLKERLQPALLDRLTDDEPDKKVESRDKRVLSLVRLREYVRRDLAWLLNATNLTSIQNLDDYPEVENSTVNYGVPDLSGKSKSGIEVADIEKLIKQAVWRFEPRLNKKSVRVTLAGDPTKIKYNNMCFNIEAELWAQPLPIRLFLKTELDLESGNARVTEVSASGDG